MQCRPRPRPRSRSDMLDLSCLTFKCYMPVYLFKFQVGTFLLLFITLDKHSLCVSFICQCNERTLHCSRPI